MKILLEKLTQVVSQSGMKHGLSGIHICRVIYEKQGVFFAGNCKPVCICKCNGDRTRFSERLEVEFQI